MPNITLAEAAKMVRKLSYEGNGKIFTVEFIKRGNGERRTMNCRGEVKKGVKGVGLAYDPNKKSLVSVYDMQAQAFKMIAEEGIQIIRAGGQEYIVVN